MKSNIRLEYLSSWFTLVALSITLIAGCSSDSSRATNDDGCGTHSYLERGECFCYSGYDWCSRRSDDLNCCRVDDDHWEDDGPWRDEDPPRGREDVYSGGDTSGSTPGGSGDVSNGGNNPGQDTSGDTSGDITPPLPRCAQGDWNCVRQRCEAAYQHMYACGEEPDWGEETECYDYLNPEEIYAPHAVRECPPLEGALWSCLSQLSCLELGQYVDETVHHCQAEEYATASSSCAERVEEEAPEPEFVNVLFLEALVAPTKADGCQWDGRTCSQKTDQVLIDALSYAAAAFISAKTGGTMPISATANVLSRVTGAVFESLGKPDPYGILDYYGPTGENYYCDIDTIQDTYKIGFPPCGHFNGNRAIPLRNGAGGEFVLELWDEDLSNDDFIGTVTLGIADLRYALRVGQDVWIPTARRIEDGILMVKIKVSAAR